MPISEEDDRPDSERPDAIGPSASRDAPEAPRVDGQGGIGGGRRMGAAVVAGLVAGALAWLGGEGVVAIETADQSFVPANQGQIGQHDAMILEATIMKASASFAVLGASIGLVMGVAGGLLRGMPKAAAGAGLGGAVLGGTMIATVSMVALPRFLEDTEQLEQGMLEPILMHGLLWSTAGLAGGIAFAVGLGCRPTTVAQAAIGGVIGAVLGAAIYDIVGAVLWATDKTGMPLSESWYSRLLSRMCVSVAVAITSAALIDQRRPPTPQRPNAPDPGR